MSYLLVLMQYIIDILFTILYNADYREAMVLKNMKMKLARTERELSQEQLADAVGVTRQTIGMIEAGKFNPSLQLCLSICRALNKTLNDLFWEDRYEAH